VPIGLRASYVRFAMPTVVVVAPTIEEFVDQCLELGHAGLCRVRAAWWIWLASFVAETKANAGSDSVAVPV
jgi:hypothetical protein